MARLSFAALVALVLASGSALADDVPVFTAMTPVPAGHPLLRHWQRERPGVVKVYPIELRVPDFNAKTLVIVFEGKQYRFVDAGLPNEDPTIMDSWNGFDRPMPIVGNPSFVIGLWRMKPQHFWERGPGPLMGGFSLPGRFFAIDVYEKQGVLVEIDRKLLEQAAKDGTKYPIEDD
jgi:hypothetical protein